MRGSLLNQVCTSFYLCGLASATFGVPGYMFPANGLQNTAIYSRFNSNQVSEYPTHLPAAQTMAGLFAVPSTQPIAAISQSNFFNQQILNILCQELISSFYSAKEETLITGPVEDNSPSRPHLKNRQRPFQSASTRPFKRPKTSDTRIEIHVDYDNSNSVYEHDKYNPSRLALYHLNCSTHYSDLLCILESIGPVKALTLLKMSDAPYANTAFVEFKDPSDAQKAFVSLRGTCIHSFFIGVNWSPDSFNRRSRNLKIVYTRKTLNITVIDKAALFDRYALSRRFGKCLNSYWKPGSNRHFLRFENEYAAEHAFATFTEMGFDVHYVF